MWLLMAKAVLGRFATEYECGICAFLFLPIIGRRVIHSMHLYENMLFWVTLWFIFVDMNVWKTSLCFPFPTLLRSWGICTASSNGLSFNSALPFSPILMNLFYLYYLSMQVCLDLQHWQCKQKEVRMCPVCPSEQGTAGSFMRCEMSWAPLWQVTNATPGALEVHSGLSLRWPNAERKYSTSDTVYSC